MTASVMAACLAALVPAGLRWLRVAQREHYAPGRVSRFALRWWSIPSNLLLLVAGIACTGLATSWPVLGLAAAGVAAFAPVGLRVRGVSSPVRWTPRLRRLSIGTAILVGFVVVIGSLPAAAAAVLGLPLFVDGALWVLRPLEYRLSRKWVRQARRRLSEVNPLCVAITGSYGKTTTKTFCAQLLANRHHVVASPASFNNELGLARAINDHLAPGTEIFVAEMGTYGPGEIRRLVAWIRPTISVITAIGPVHLERFGSTEAIVSAKSEIMEGAQAVVLNIDSPELRELAKLTLAGGATEVVRCSSTDAEADIYVGAADGKVVIGGTQVGFLARPPTFAGNLACAAGVAWALGMRPDLASLERLLGPEHRRQMVKGDKGFAIIDDTYNSNPSGARAALSLLEDRAGRRVVVTPGMVELGRMQQSANREFADAAASVATDLLLVGRTNRRSLLEGARDGKAAVRLVRSRQEAVEWARQNLGPGDIVLYENDLPDHFP